MHCVQACLKTLLHYFDMPVLSFKELDKITGHDPDKFTWMSKALLWLASKRLHVLHIENLDYVMFSKQGEKYLKNIWDAETFKVQDQYSNLKAGQKDAAKLVASKNITLLNKRLNVSEIKSLFKMGNFVMLSINPNVLKDKNNYGSHLVVVAGFKNGKVRLCDPDAGLTWYKEKTLQRAISSKYKPDFSVTLVSSKPIRMI